MGRFVAAAEDLKRSMSRGSVILAHHSSKSGPGLRGSSVLEGAAETVYLASRRHDETFVLSCDKQKDGPRGDLHVFDLVPSGPSVVLAAEGERATDDTRQTATVALWKTLDVAFGAGSQTFTRAEAMRVATYSGQPVDGKLSSSAGYRAFGELLNMDVLVQVENAETQADRFRVDRERALAMHFPIHHTHTRLSGLPTDVDHGLQPF